MHEGGACANRDQGFVSERDKVAEVQMPTQEKREFKASTKQTRNRNGGEGGCTVGSTRPVSPFAGMLHTAVRCHPQLIRETGACADVLECPGAKPGAAYQGQAPHHRLFPAQSLHVVVGRTSAGYGEGG